MASYTGRKTVLDLARELGIRTETVIHALQRLGVPESLQEINPALEQQLIEQMAADGAISAALSRGTKRRPAKDRVLANDEILLEALGAGEIGFSREEIPPAVRRLLDSLPKPSRFRRWWGRSHPLTTALVQNPLSPEEVEALFPAPLPPLDDPANATGPEAAASPSPPGGLVTDEGEKLPEDRSGFEEPDESEDLDPVLDESGLQPPRLSPESTAEIVDEEIPINEEAISSLDPNLLSEIDALKQGETDDLNEIELSELEQLEGLEDLEGLEVLNELDEPPRPGQSAPASKSDSTSLRIMEENRNALEDAPGEEDQDNEEDQDSLEDLDEIDDLEEIESLGDLDEDETLDSSEIEKELEETTQRLERQIVEEPMGWAEQILSRIQLTPLEMWTLIGGTAVTLAALLGVAGYWWWNVSPQAQTGLFEEAGRHSQSATALSGNGGWKQARKEWQAAADAYEKFVNQFSSNPKRREEAFYLLCDAYYQIAQGDEKAGDTRNAEDAYRRMINYYQKYLEFLEKTASQMADIQPRQPHLAYPDINRQQTALFRIALAHKKLQHFDIAIEKLKSFAQRFGSTSAGREALMQVGHVYRDWAKLNQEQELPLLNEAAAAYAEALQKTPADVPAERMRLYACIGDICSEKYQRSLANQNPEEANSHLVEAAANYENAVAEARQYGLETLAAQPNGMELVREILKTKKTLGDLYLLRGREAGEKWREYENLAAPFPDSIIYKQKLLDAAELKKNATVQFLEKANALYQELLGESDWLDARDFDDIRYHITESHFILREFPQALAAGDAILSSTRPPRPEAETQLQYLLGHAAWEQAKETGDYTRVKNHYHRALELDDFYPASQKGETSHLAEIRLINAYYMLDKRYEEALRRFQSAVERYPDTGYSYLTLYWFANATQEYADSLMDEADRLETALQPPGGAAKSAEEARSLREKARSLYTDAIDRYNRAAASRDKSKYVDTRHETFLSDILFSRGHAAYKAGLYTEAEKYFQEALNRYRDNPVAQKYIPSALERLGDLNTRLANYGKAIRYYQEYLNNPYEDANARVSLKLAEAYLKQYSYNQARQVYQKIARDYPAPAPQESERLLRLGRVPEKGPGFEALKKIAESYFQEAATHILEDREAKLRLALQAYQELITRYPLSPNSPHLPEDADSLYKIALIQSELGNLPEAVTTYEAFLQQVPDYPRQGLIYYKIAQACLDMNPPDCDKAIDSLKHVDEQLFDSPAQFADALILQGQAWEKKAHTALAAGDKDLYMAYLDQAGRIYNRAASSPDPQKNKEALVMRQAIESILEGHKELSNAKNP